MDPTRYSYAACLRKGDGPAKKDVATAVSLFERLADEGLLEAKVDSSVDLPRGRLDENRRDRWLIFQGRPLR